MTTVPNADIGLKLLRDKCRKEGTEHAGRNTAEKKI